MPTRRGIVDDFIRLFDSAAAALHVFTGLERGVILCVGLEYRQNPREQDGSIFKQEPA